MLIQSARYPKPYGLSLVDRDDRYADRAAAGRALATLLQPYRGGRAIVLALPSLGRRPVIPVDDGLNTGFLELAALAALRHYHPQRCIVATPFGTPATLGHIARMADELVTLTHGTGERQDAITHWQQALGDDDAAALLHRWQIDAAIRDIARATRNTAAISMSSSGGNEPQC